MKPFQLDEHFFTHLKEVDTQHEKLVELVNQLQELLKADSVDAEEADALFNQIAQDTAQHFSDEESLMVNSGIAKEHLQKHIHEHRNFLSEVGDLYSELVENSYHQSFAHNLFLFVTHWLSYHILGQDHAMARQIKLITNGESADDAYCKIEMESCGATQTLLEALNSLLEQVSERNKELRRLNQKLEEKVEIRTQELLSANEHLEKLSTTDVLTGLANRRKVIHILQSFWDDPTLNTQSLVCIMIDVDNFKQVNDNYGHDVGDEVLIEVANALKGAFRSNDLVCRLGGDEFIVICPKLQASRALTIAKRAHSAVNKVQVMVDEQHYWYGSISVGVAVRQANMKSYNELIKAADQGVYLAKEAGRNCVKMA